jgi:hypothetical protein
MKILVNISKWFGWTALQVIAFLALYEILLNAAASARGSLRSDVANGSDLSRDIHQRAVEISIGWTRIVGSNLAAIRCSKIGGIALFDAVKIRL